MLFVSDIFNHHSKKKTRIFQLIFASTCSWQIGSLQPPPTFYTQRHFSLNATSVASADVCSFSRPRSSIESAIELKYSVGIQDGRTPI